MTPKEKVLLRRAIVFVSQKATLDKGIAILAMLAAPTKAEAARDARDRPPLAELKRRLEALASKDWSKEIFG